MNVLVVCSDWSDAAHARWLARGLAATGDRATVLVREGGGARGLSRRIAERGYEVAFLGAASTPLDVERAVDSLLAEAHFDLAHLLSVEGALARVASLLDCAGVPLVHSALEAGAAVGQRWPAAETRRLCGRFARVLVAESAVAQAFLEAGVDPLRLLGETGGQSPWGTVPPGFDDGLQPILRVYGEVLEERARPRLPAKDRLVAVVLHERGLGQTLAAVRALGTGSLRPDAVVVVDNAPDRGAAPFLRAGLPGAQLLEVDRAESFAAGANIGLARAMALGADRVLFLSGEVLVLPDTVLRLSNALARFEALGVVGPVLREQAAPHTVVTGGMRWSPRSGRVTHAGRGTSYRGAPDWELQQVDGLSSLAMLITRHTLDAVGRFDQGGVPGFLALDFCLRARGKGFGVACLPSASALHAPAPREGHPLRRLLEARAQLALAQTHAPRSALPALARGAAIVASHAAEVVEKRAPRRARAVLAVARAGFAQLRSLTAPG